MVDLGFSVDKGSGNIIVVVLKISLWGEGARDVDPGHQEAQVWAGRHLQPPQHPGAPLTPVPR